MKISMINKQDLLLSSLQWYSNKNICCLMPILLSFIYISQVLSDTCNLFFKWDNPWLYLKNNRQVEYLYLKSSKIIKISKKNTLSNVKCETAFEISSGTTCNRLLTSVKTCLEITKLTFSLTTKTKKCLD